MVGFEPTTFSLAMRHSTTELHPRWCSFPAYDGFMCRQNYQPGAGSSQEHCPACFTLRKSPKVSDKDPTTNPERAAGIEPASLAWKARARNHYTKPAMICKYYRRPLARFFSRPLRATASRILGALSTEAAMSTGIGFFGFACDTR